MKVARLIFALACLTLIAWPVWGQKTPTYHGRLDVRSPQELTPIVKIVSEETPTGVSVTHNNCTPKRGYIITVAQGSKLQIQFQLQNKNGTMADGAFEAQIAMGQDNQKVKGKFTGTDGGEIVIEPVNNFTVSLKLKSR